MKLLKVSSSEINLPANWGNNAGDQLLYQNSGKLDQGESKEQRGDFLLDKIDFFRGKETFDIILFELMFFRIKNYIAFTPL